MEANTTMTICPNNHPYDTAKYAVCPICGARAGTLPTSPLSGGFTPTEPISGVPGSFVATEPIGGPGGFTSTEPVSATSMGGVSSGAFNPTLPPDMPEAFAPTIAGDMISSGDGGGRTEPVVGWLVCVDGPVRGTDYRIHAGYNYIGRSSGDICIRGDNQISRQNHAMIAFDSSELTYFVGPAAGRNLIKVNGKTVLNAVEIHSYDIISIGTTKLLFVALCNERFSWPTEGSANG